MTKAPLRFRPNVTVACVIEAQDHFLLVEERIDGAIRFNQPAGHLESGESLLAACKREVWEETGLTVAPQGLIRIHQWKSASGVEFLRFAFGCRLPAPLEVAPQDPQIIAAHWLTLEQIRSRASDLRTPLVLQAIHDFRNRPMTAIELIEASF